MLLVVRNHYSLPVWNLQRQFCTRIVLGILRRLHEENFVEDALRPVTPPQQAEADLARIKAEKLPTPAGVQTALAEHYQALLHTNDFYQYLTLFKELGQKRTQQQSRGRKINAMDTYFYQMVEHVLREELAVSFGESQQEAGRRLQSVLN